MLHSYRGKTSRSSGVIPDGAGVCAAELLSFAGGALPLCSKDSSFAPEEPAD